MATPEQRALAQQIQQIINTRPQNFEMADWVIAPDTAYGTELLPEDILEVPEGSCNTTLCLAGWAVLLSGIPIVYSHGDGFVPNSDDGDWISAGSRLLGISTNDGNELFMTDNENAKRGLELLTEGKSISNYASWQEDYETCGCGCEEY